MINFKDIAKEAVSGCELMANREKMLTEDLIDDYEDGVTIIDLMQAEVTNKDATGKELVWVFTTVEEPKFYTFAGYSLSKIFNEYLQAYKGDYTQLREDFKKSGGLKCKFTRTRTKKGNVFTDVKII